MLYVFSVIIAIGWLNMPYCWWNFRVNNWFTKACDGEAQTRKLPSGVVETAPFRVFCRAGYRK
jgi:hypothetical protein